MSQLQVARPSSIAVKGPCPPFRLVRCLTTNPYPTMVATDGGWDHSRYAPPSIYPVRKSGIGRIGNQTRVANDFMNGLRDDNVGTVPRVRDKPEWRSTIRTGVDKQQFIHPKMRPPLLHPVNFDLAMRPNGN